VRIGTGILLLVLGSVLYAAVDVDLPYLDDDALGLILVVGGLVVTVAAVAMKKDRPEVGAGIGLVLMAVGAILAVAIRVDLPYVADYALGTIFLMAGFLALVATLVTIVQQRMRGTNRTF
jgi:hypothetical protein